MPWILLPSGIGQIVLRAALLIAGVNEQRWSEQARVAGSWPRGH